MVGIGRVGMAMVSMGVVGVAVVGRGMVGVVMMSRGMVGVAMAGMPTAVVAEQHLLTVFLSSPPHSTHSKISNWEGLLREGHTR